MTSGSIRPNDARPTIAIVGGGFSGAVCAHQLARRAPGAFRIVVVEPRPRLGAGVAYSTMEPAHRINVPAARMCFVPSDPCHFDRWLKADTALRADPEAIMPDGRAFPQRGVFGRYVAETLEPFLLAGEIEHVCARATSIRPGDFGGYVVSVEGGAPVGADGIVLAVTHPSPSPPEALVEVADDSRFIRDTQTPGALDAVKPDDRVLIVGTGLTMADIVAALERRGHRGPILAISRRGLLSRGHAAVAGEYGDFSTRPSRTARELVKAIRAAVVDAAAEGRPWQHPLEAVRTQGRAIWGALPQAERRKVARRLRSFWDVHRFRIAPQIEEAIARLRREGRLTILTGQPISASADLDAIRATFRLRSGAIAEGSFDAVALATGPGHRDLSETSPLVANLAAQGIVRPDPYGLGLAVDEASLAIGRAGRAADDFWIAGPLARGTFGELMGLPEVTKHAEFVAAEIIKAIESQTPRIPLEVA